MKRRVFSILGLIIGLSLIAASIYFYFFSGKTVLSSDDVVIETPETAVRRTIQLEEKDNPFKVFLNVSYDVENEPKNDEYPLFSYHAALENRSGQLIQEKSSSYTHRVRRGDDEEEPTGKKEDTITLLTMSDIPTDTYALSLVIQPNESLDPTIKLQEFSYQIKSNVTIVHPALPLAGAVLSLVSLIFLPRKKMTKDDTPQTA